MLILLADARGGVRRDRLARSKALLTSEPPFRDLSSSARQALIGKQRAIAAFALEQAVETLPALMTEAADRTRALSVVAAVAGPGGDGPASPPDAGAVPRMLAAG
jgi:hypothetical protein